MSLRYALNRPRSRWLVSGLALGVLATGVNCTGQIGPTEGNPDPTNPTGTGTGNPSTGNPSTGNPSTGNPSTKPEPVLTGTDPGRVTIHRLNKTEYNNTVRDLIGTTLRPADEFPPDFQGAGFDNVADALGLSPVQMAMYQAAAEVLSDEAVKPGSRLWAGAGCALTAGEACARTAIKTFAKRAWRRPVTDQELAPHLALLDLAKAQSDTPEVGLKLAVQALLMSPNFLFRIELDGEPTSLSPRALNDHEVASRLSYFVWSTMPDDALMAAADAGTLRTAADLNQQIDRMLKDQKAASLVDNFAGQWLYTRLVEGFKPDAAMFPTFDAELKAAMQQETEMLFKEIAFGGAPANQLLASDYTFLNDRLASHYGLPAVGSSTMQKVKLSNPQRGGLLGQATVLTHTSHPTSTSPVLRGKWVLTDLLCDEVPPPPGNVDTSLSTSMTGATVRQRLESHRSNPTCASCHSVMDPVGFGFEHYDPVGAYRTMDNGSPVDASGEYFDGTKFSGIQELGAKLVADERFAKCMTEKLYVYALGRAPVETPNHMDPSTIDVLASRFRAGGYKFESLVKGIITADTFLKRRGEAAIPGGAP